MKVLYLINHAGKGGSEQYVLTLMEACRERGVPCCLCYNEEGPLADRVRDLGFDAFRLEMRSPFDRKAAKALSELCRREGVDVIHAQYPRENYIAILARRYGSPARVVFTAHLILEQPLAWRILNRLMTPGDSAVIAVCTWGAEVLRKNGVRQDRIVTIFNGVAPAAAPGTRAEVREALGIGESTPVLITLARLSHEKGVDFLLEIAAALRKRTGIPFRVLVAGDGEEEQALLDRRKALGLEDTVTFLGYRTDAPALLEASDVYLNTSRQEAMSLSILEAAALSLPVAATDVGGNRDIVLTEPPCGFVSPFGDAEAFAERLLPLVEDPELRKSLGRAALDKTRDLFSRDRTLSKTFAAYEQALQ